MTVLRTFIYGSCVSRDTFEYLPQAEYQLVTYVARQSLISAFTPADAHQMPELALSSSFQRRMVEGDWRGSLPSQLEAVADDVDLVLWDLCDERLGVIELSANPPIFVTRSVETISAGLDATLSELPRLHVGDPDHLTLFTQRVGDFMSLLDRLGLKDRLVVLAPDWASKTIDGEAAPRSFGWSAPEANAAFAPYVDLLTSRAGAPVLTLPEPLVRTDPKHRWGAAPFHYTAAAYSQLAGGIRQANTLI